MRAQAGPRWVVYDRREHGAPKGIPSYGMTQEQCALGLSAVLVTGGLA